MEEDEDETKDEESCFEQEVPARVLPPLLDEDLGECLLVDVVVSCVVEVLEETQSGGVVAGRELDDAPRYLGEVLLVGALLLQFLLELG